MIKDKIALIEDASRETGRSAAEIEHELSAIDKDEPDSWEVPKVLQIISFAQSFDLPYLTLSTGMRQKLNQTAREIHNSSRNGTFKNPNRVNGKKLKHGKEK